MSTWGRFKARRSSLDMWPGDCFDRAFQCWHAICEKKLAMLKIEFHHPDTSVEPAPSFATDAEIALAEQLRHQLEERYFGLSAARSLLPAPSRRVH